MTQTFITLTNQKSLIPAQFQSDDNRFPESLAEYFINQYTKPGDRVLDPFA
jgi:DNA modification methylase